MTDTSSTGVDTSREKHVFGWFIFPILLLFPLVALLTYDWRAIAALHTPPQATTNWVGALGDAFAYHGYMLVGLAVWIIPVACIALGLALVFARRGCGLRSIAWFVVLLAACACLLQVAQHHAPGIKAAISRLNLSDAGGAIGYLVMTRLLSPLLSDFGGSVIMILVALVALVEVIGPKNIAAFFVALYHWATAHGHVAPSREAAEKDAIRAAKEAARAEREAAKEAARAPLPGEQPTAATGRASAEPAQEEPVVDKGPYILPSLSLLNPLRPSAADHSDVGEMSQRLVSTLKLFGVDARLDYTVQGPVVTKYAIELAPGTRYSQSRSASRRRFRERTESASRSRTASQRGSASARYSNPRRGAARRPSFPFSSASAPTERSSSQTSRRCRTCSSQARPDRASRCASTRSSADFS